MRTTVAIDDDVLDVARSQARLEQRSLGEAISDLARKGLHPEPRLSFRSGFPVVEVSPEAPPISLERVRQLLDEDA